MTSHVVPRPSPEQCELARKYEHLQQLSTELAHRELELLTLRTELAVFERRYLTIVGARYAELDDIRAEIAETHARLHPHLTDAQHEAVCARAQAAASQLHSAAPTDAPRVADEQVKMLYRQLSKMVHPDLAADDDERLRRQEIMAAVNAAYRAGDAARLDAIRGEWEHSPDGVRGEGTGMDLIRAIRTIARVERRMAIIADEVAACQRKDLYQLKQRVDTAEAAGIDLLGNMAVRVDSAIREARARLREMIAGSPA